MKHFFCLFCFVAVAIAAVACGGRRTRAQAGNESASDTESVYVETEYPIEIDISKKYEQGAILLQDVAEVSYVPYETNKDVLLDRAAESRLTVSDSLIITHDWQGTVFIMGRDGRFISKFNRQGRGPNEYSDLVELAVDFNRGEIYVYSSQLDYKIMVYSLSGEFKRKISIPHPMYVASMKNYDKDNLLVWTTVTPGAQKDMAAKGHFPRYYYVSKNTGEFASLPLMVSEYRDGRLTQNSNGYYRVSGYGAFPITYNGDEIVLSDYACDTIYTLNGGRLSPFIVSVNAKENEDVGVVFKTTRYTVLSVGELGEDVNADHAQKFLGVDHRSGNIFEVEFLNADNGEIVPCDRLSDNYKSLPVETAVTGYSALTLVDQRDAGKLKGRLAEVTATMKEDDNPVLMFIKFKK